MVHFRCKLLRGRMPSLEIAWYKKTKDKWSVQQANNGSFVLLDRVTLPVNVTKHVVRYRCVVWNADGSGVSPEATLTVVKKGEF